MGIVVSMDERGRSLLSTTNTTTTTKDKRRQCGITKPRKPEASHASVIFKPKKDDKIPWALRA